MSNILQDLAAERAVLAGIITHGSQGYDEVTDFIKESTFTHELNQIIFACCKHCLKNKHDGNIELSSILSSANSLGLGSVLDKVETKKYLRTVINFPILLKNLQGFAAKLSKLEISRDLQRTLIETGQSFDKITGDEEIDYILSLAERPVLDATLNLGRSRNTGPVILGEGIQEYIDYLKNNPCEMIGVPTGYKLYDKCIGGGLRPGTISMIGARIKVGKTSLVDNIALNISSLGIPVLNLDTEMSKDEHKARILANLSGVTINDIETGLFGKNYEKARKVDEAGAKFSQMPYSYINVCNMPFEEILSIARRWIHKTVGVNDDGRAKTCVVILDYFRLMNGEALKAKNLQEYQALGFQINALNNFILRYGVSNLSMIQLNRDGITAENTGVISGSDRQGWTCANLSIFKLKSDDELVEMPKGNRKLVPLVARHGECLEPKDYINMCFHTKINRIVEHKTLFQYKKEQGGFKTDASQSATDIKF